MSCDERPGDKRPDGKQSDIVESLAKHFPKETGELLTAAKEVLLTWTGSKPEQIKADLQIQSRVYAGLHVSDGSGCRHCRVPRIRESSDGRNCGFHFRNRVRFHGDFSLQIPDGVRRVEVVQEK